MHGAAPATLLQARPQACLPLPRPVAPSPNHFLPAAAPAAPTPASLSLQHVRIVRAAETLSVTHADVCVVANFRDPTQQTFRIEFHTEPWRLLHLP